MAMKDRQVNISIKDVPEVLAALRRELANMLRSAADDEPPRLAMRMKEIAAGRVNDSKRIQAHQTQETLVKL